MRGIKRNDLRFALLLPFALALASCSYADRLAEISDRAVQYNLDAEQVEDRQVLLNIVRAVYQMPPEFTSLQTMTGQSSMSGTAAITWPWRKGGAKQPSLFNAGGSLTVTPQFTMGVIDTQEFYNGILKPVDSATIDLYYRRRYSPTLLFNLFIREIAVKQRLNPAEPENVLLIKNNAAAENTDLERFQGFVEYLLNLGLATGSKKPTALGAPLLPEEAQDLAQLARAATAGLEVKTSSWCDLTEGEKRAVLQKKGKSKEYDDLKELCGLLGGSNTSKEKEKADLNLNTFLTKWDLPPVLYRAQKSGQPSVRLCFDSPPSPPPKLKNPDLDAEKETANEIAVTDAACNKRPANKKAKPEVDLAASQEAKKSLEDLGTQTPAASIAGITLNKTRVEKILVDTGGINFTKPVTLEFTPRSPEGMIYYLGEVVRRQLDLRSMDDKSRYVHIKYGPPDRRIPDDCGASETFYTCDERLFVVDRIRIFDKFGSGENAPYSPLLRVSYDNKSYATPSLVGSDGRPNREKAGLTFQVLAIVRQLIGLQRSAKDLPVSNVFTLITP
jgi:hypothetical protein